MSGKYLRIHVSDSFWIVLFFGGFSVNNNWEGKVWFSVYCVIGI
jgi:hypothetical protein